MGGGGSKGGRSWGVRVVLRGEGGGGGSKLPTSPAASRGNTNIQYFLARYSYIGYTFTPQTFISLYLQSTWI